MKLIRVALMILFLTGVACAARTATPSVASETEQPKNASVTVRVLGLEVESGQIAVALYDSAQSFKDRTGAVASGKTDPQDGAATWTVESIDPGIYAVAAYHDLNENDQLDRSALGAPAEPYGFSNDARGRFGPPKFEKAAIQIGPGPLTIEITLR